MNSKLIIFSSPSGAGKTTIVKHLMSCNFNLVFSVSATSRPVRQGEKDGVDYYFLSAYEFENKVGSDEFLEWEEVYEGLLYGTLKSEVDKALLKGSNVIFDVDVLGALNIKRHYAARALSVFVQPPSLEALELRLRGRRTESEESLLKRLKRAGQEMGYAAQFDRIIINDDLDKALRQAEEIIEEFLSQEPKVQ